MVRLFVLYVMVLCFFRCTALTQKFTLVIDYATFPGKSKAQIAVNGTVPGPVLNITLGNSVELLMINNIHDQFTALHMHGMTQYKTPFSDGVPALTQCLVSNFPGNNTFLYTFTPDKVGTYWYHGHHQLHYTDGFYGAFIVYDSQERHTYAALGSPYGEEKPEWSLLFADWYDVAAASLINDFLSPASEGVEPLPDAFTVNNRFSGDFSIEVDPNGDPVRVRVVNAGSLSMVAVSVDGMPLQVIELDSTPIQPLDLQYVRLNIGQRFSFVLDFSRIDPKLANSSAVKIRFTLMPEMYNQYNKSAPYYNLYGVSSGKPLSINWEGLIKFKGRNYPVDYSDIPVLNLPSPPDTNILEAKSLGVSNKAPRPDYSFYILVNFANNAQGANRAYLNGYEYAEPRYYGGTKQTTEIFHYMYDNVTIDDYASVSPKNKKVILGDARSPVVFPYGKCVELFINNTDTGEHPFHLHGHSFWIVSTTAFPNAESLYKNNYLIRDVISIPAKGWAKIRFLTTNPGVWMFHCHIPWHQLAGFAMSFLVAPSKLRNHSSWISTVPSTHVAACNIPIKRIIKLGGYFNLINPSNTSHFNSEQAQSLAAFMMAVHEINTDPDLLPNFELRVAVRSGTDDFAGAISAAEYLALTAPFQYFENPLSRYVSGTNIGVDIVVGAGSNVETTGMDQFFNGRQILQVHTVANDPQLQTGANYPYKIASVPVSTYEGRILHMLACQHYQYTQVVIFAVNNVYGTGAVSEMNNQAYCNWNILALYSFSPERTDFRKEIQQAKGINVQVFMLVFDNPAMAGMLVEQAYDLGLFRQGTQLFGTEAVTSSQLWNSFQNKDNTAAIMKGFIGIKYDPSYSTRTTNVGRNFIQKFRNLPSIGGATNSCYVDKTGSFSVGTIKKFTVCHKLNFSSFAIDGSDIYPYAPHAYDAVYAIAHALNEMLEVNRALTLDASTLVSKFFDPTVVNFQGVTGDFAITSGSSVYPFERKGDREVGFTYKIFNYDTVAEDLVLVGKFSDAGVTQCSTSSHLIDGVPCQSITYNTADNLPAGNLAPYSLESFPAVLKVGGFFKPFDAQGNPDPLQAQCLAAFLLAIKEINQNTTLLPNTNLVSGIVSGIGFLQAISAADYLVANEFGGTGVNIVVGAGDDIETEAMNQIFAQSKTIQIHTISRAVELSQGALYPWRLQTTPLESYQGRLLQTIGCKFGRQKRVAVFVINSLYGSMTLADFQSSSSECALNVVSVSMLEYGTVDFSAALGQAKQAQTRLFALLLDEPTMAGQLLEQGYNLGLFRLGTEILGTEDITTPLTWKAIVNKRNVVNIMKGFIGLRYSPGLGMMSTPQGQNFIKRFIDQTSTQYTNADGSISCDANSLDDSGQFFLYSQRNMQKTYCSGLNFSHFNSTGANIYPYAAHVYDAVYAIAYAVQHHLADFNKTTTQPSDVYSYFLKGTNFNGASGSMAFTPGSKYYPYNNRGNREVGHKYLIYQFNEALYASTVNGSGAFGVIGVFDPRNVSRPCRPGSTLQSGEVCNKVVYNTFDGSPPVNNDIYVSLAWSTQMCSFVFAGILFTLAAVFASLTYRFSTFKVIHANQREMIYFVLLGAMLCSVRIMLIGLNVTDTMCISKLWIGHIAFCILYGVLFRQVWSEFLELYGGFFSQVARRDAKVFSSKYSSIRASLRSNQNASDQSLTNSFKKGGKVVLKGSWSMLNNLLTYFFVFFVAYLALATYFGAPRSSFFTQYFNLETAHEYICTSELPITESILYAIEGLLLFVGVVICIFLRPYLDHLVESKANMIAIIISISTLFVVSIAVFGLDSAGLFTENVDELILSTGAFFAVSVVILLLCSPPFYLILSIKYDRLMIHEILMNNDSTEQQLLDFIQKNKCLLYKRDRYGQNAFQVALEYNVSDEILLELIHYFLPLDPVSRNPIPEEDHGYAWIYLVQKDRNADIVEKILYKHASICMELAKATDSEGRSAMNIASHTCQRIIKESTYFCKRYEVTTLESPVHLSRTCVVHLALDHRHSGEKVALKLMKNFDQYNREVTVRKEARLSNDFTINILRTHDINSDDRYMEEIRRRGWDEYLYCIVMPCADRDLNRIITNEHIAGKEWGQIKSITIEIAKALQHMHNSGVIHGDVKSKNIMRIGHRVKFIDFDASVRIGKDFVGAKYSSAFVPPEMIFFRERTMRRGPGKPGDASPQQYQDKRVSEWKQYSGRYFEDHDNICVKAYDIDPATGDIKDKDKLPFELNIAHYSYDTWAFGVVLFELCAGISLFLANSEDNILYENMLDLYAFTDKYKKKRMSEIVNVEARNLVAQMLTRDPLKRPQMSQVLAHPFLSGKKATRLFGEVAEFDVFLSYRKQSDENHAQLMYTKLTDAGLKVWWDKRSLVPGVPWQEGFCDGLAKSLVFLPILSREAINSSSVEKQNFTLLSRSSNCDNVLLEYRLALELVERGFLESVYPLLVGDIVTDGDKESYSDYFLTDCHPKCTNHVIVDSVENALQDQLNRLCFGTPLIENPTVPVILDHIVRNQGGLVEGPTDRAFETSVDDIISIVEEKRKKLSLEGDASERVHTKKLSREIMHHRLSTEYAAVAPPSLDFSAIPMTNMRDESMTIDETPMTVEDLA